MGNQKIEDIYGNEKEIDCLSCAIQKGEVETPGGVIAESEYFEAQQDYEIPIPGFVILVSKRHLTSFADFTKKEQTDFIQFLCSLRKGMRNVLGIDTVYFVQEEDTEHHFHVWLFPRYQWMDKFGKKVKSLRTIMEHARENMKTEEQLAKVDRATEKLKSSLQE